MEDNKNQDKVFHKTNINWYPGHMAKTKRQIIEDLRLIDVIIEILDARIPISSQNPDVKEYTKNKTKIVILNKSDLAENEENQKWIKYFNKQEISAILVNSNTGEGIDNAIKEIHKVAQDSQEKYANKGRVGKSIRVMIVGIPNVGKSSFINRIIKKAVTQVGNKPGVTRQKQWIRLTDGIELMDTPGVLWPKFGNNETALNLAFTGTIKDDILEKTEIVCQLIKYLIKDYKTNLLERYKITEGEYQEIIQKDILENEKIVEIMKVIGQKRGAILSGGKVDLEKVSAIILDEFRSGKLGKITLEKVI